MANPPIIKSSDSPVLMMSLVRSFFYVKGFVECYEDDQLGFVRFWVCYIPGSTILYKCSHF